MHTIHVQGADFIAHAAGYHMGLLVQAARSLYTKPGSIKPPWAGMLSKLSSCSDCVEAENHVQRVRHCIVSCLLEPTERHLLATWQLFSSAVVPLNAARIVHLACLEVRNAAAANTAETTRQVRLQWACCGKM